MAGQESGVWVLRSVLSQAPCSSTSDRGLTRQPAWHSVRQDSRRGPMGRRHSTQAQNRPQAALAAENRRGRRWQPQFFSSSQRTEKQCFTLTDPVSVAKTTLHGRICERGVSSPGAMAATLSCRGSRGAATQATQGGRSGPRRMGLVHRRRERSGRAEAPASTWSRPFTRGRPSLAPASSAGNEAAQARAASDTSSSALQLHRVAMLSQNGTRTHPHARRAIAIDQE